MGEFLGIATRNEANYRFCNVQKKDKIVQKLGFAPVVGSVVNAANGAIHVARGNYVEAGFSFYRLDLIMLI
ncbi:MAG: hypothetical protein LBP87_06810 [Planctomycetaceae bacterium]|nr:hypothetical protein [Planctomycetaceae bacterium]